MSVHHSIAALLLTSVFVAAWWLSPWAPAVQSVQGPDVPNVGRAVSANVDPRQPAERQEVIGGAAGCASPSPHRVRVAVLLPNGDPAPGATVRYWPPRTPEQRVQDAAAVESGRDLEAALLATGLVATADADGTVELEVDADGQPDADELAGAPICARLGQLYGEGDRVPDAADGVRRMLIELAPDVSPAIEVGDVSGAPQEGIQVQVALQVATRRQGIVIGNWMLATDAQGKAMLPHLQRHADLRAEGLAGTVDFRCVRSTLRDGRRSSIPIAAKTVAWTQLRHDPRVRLQLPAGGTIALRIQDLDGVPLHCGCCLHDEQGAVFARSETEGDLETFRALPLGRSWRVEIEYLERSLVVRGPSRAGETVSVEVLSPKHHWRIRGQAVRADGNSFAVVPVYDEVLRMGVSLVLHTPTEARELGQWRCAMQRPFELGFDLDVAELRRLDVRIEPAPNSLAEAKTFVFERPLTSGDVDLGKLVLPVARELVTLATVEVRSCDRVLTAETDFGVSDEGGQLPLPWLAVPRGDAVELRGRPATGALALECIHPGFRTRIVRPVRQGEHCRVELQPAAALRVDMLPLDVPSWALRGELVPRGGSDRAVDALAAGNPLTWSGLEPGAYALTLRIGDRVVREERQLWLAAGMNRWPSDGKPLDLRPQVRVLRVLARSAAAAAGPLIAIGVLQLPAGCRELSEGVSSSDGWFLPDAARCDLLIRARQYIPQRIASPSADVVLNMQPMTQLLLKLPLDEDGALQVRIVGDPLRDAALREFDEVNHHEATFRCWSGDENLWFAPGAEVEIRRLVDDQPGAPQRVVVGAISPQEVMLR